MTVRLLHGDCIERMLELAECSIDSIVTDPPYHLTTGKKGGTGPASVNLESPYGRARITTGFMGLAWDGGDIAFNPAVWVECLRVLKPGGHLLAFGGTRTYHRLVCAIEDAGFEIRDQIGWAFGSGFPKSHNGEWGGTALKPAWEPICVARKPLIGTVEANWREHGTGALNIDGCRVAHDEECRMMAPSRANIDSPSDKCRQAGRRTSVLELKPDGRWPANLIHDGSDEVLAAFPQAPGQQGGSAARFFYCAKASKKDRDEGCEGLPQRVIGTWGGDDDDLSTGKKSTVPRGNTHPTVKPTDLMRYLCSLVTPAGGLVLDPFAGSGSTLKAAELEGFSAIGIELDAAYIEIARRRIAADAPLFAEVA